MWEIEYTDNFGQWWDRLSEGEQVDVAAVVGLLEHMGTNLRFPHSSGIQNSKYTGMRELRIQHKGRPYRILYMFDPRRTAILLIGGSKAGNDRWYEEIIPIADKLYNEHLKILEIEKSNHEFTEL